MKFSLKIGTLLACITAILILTVPATKIFAEEPYTLLQPLPLGQPGGAVGGMVTEVTFAQYATQGFKFAIAFAGIAAVIMIMYGGFEYLLSETPFKIGDGKTKITNAVYGLVLVLIAYAVLNTINSDIVDNVTSGQLIPPIGISNQ